MKGETGMTYKKPFYFGFTNLNQKIDKLKNLMHDNKE